MSDEGGVNISLPNKVLSKQLKRKASDFLNSRKNANNLVDIIQCLEKSIGDQQNASPIIPSVLALETIFTELLKNRAMVIEVQPLKPKENSPETQYREWLQDRYGEAYQFILKCFCVDKTSDSIQALATAMNLLALEGQFPIDYVTDASYYFPCSKLRSILQCLLSADKANDHLISRFQEFTAYHDILQHSWKFLPGLTPRGQIPSETYVGNYLNLINAMPIKSAEQEQIHLLCDNNSDKGKVTFDYQAIRRNINKSWACVMHWQHTEATHQKVLMVLLERVLPHLDKPLALTDFLMDSLDAGGAISLLAFQGVFTLIQEHNLTYPFIYEKLYSMFEPEIFHTKFKARLFYLADLFLSSTHLPEALVAAFVKRLARLTLVAPPQDIVICLYFIGNLIIRHPGLKRLICHPHGGQVTRDPFIMDECDPTKSYAIDSSLWEIAALQNHGIPSIATAAKFISNPLPTIEWDLTQVLGVTEDDLFDQAIKKSSKAAFLTIDRPTSMFVPRGDRTQEFWKLF
ncbi:nucleolar complex protein 4 homolog B isoform X2 [Phlebotomus papatasi]|uniref:nucleolar complex protein 4 homolog B isoform X2 n=1 Tax=Phlebotomus papatasi TaxID=29031 RepID=UPI002483E870|nr:nucleolar complex protein 4 homolog B isoform X2 [Phlebotomus papatasi]